MNCKLKLNYRKSSLKTIRKILIQTENCVYKMDLSHFILFGVSELVRRSDNELDENTSCRLRHHLIN